MKKEQQRTEGVAGILASIDEKGKIGQLLVIGIINCASRAWFGEVAIAVSIHVYVRQILIFPLTICCRANW